MRTTSRLTARTGRAIAAITAALLLGAGYSASSHAIIGGSRSAPDQDLSTVVLRQFGHAKCGAAIVAPRTVLTAAHCVSGYAHSPALFTIRYGTHDQNEGPVAQVAEITVHPSYDSRLIDYDIAALTLEDPLPRSATILPLPLPRPGADDPPPGTTAVVTGWGRTSTDGPTSPFLLRAETRVLSRQDCQARWGGTATVTARMLCARSEGAYPCNGDSGGPLVAHGVLIGLVSWGPGTCSHPSRPTVYTNTTELRAWIHSHLT